MRPPAFGRFGGTIVKKLYVGNLPFKAMEEDVQALFAEIGVQPDSLTLLRDRFTGQPRGFGFAEVKDDDAEKSVTALNGKQFMGRALVVNEARPREGGGGGGGGRGGYGGGRGGHGGGGGRGGHGGGRDRGDYGRDR